MKKFKTDEEYQAFLEKNNDELTKEVEAILKECPDMITHALPAIHRVQRIFGNREFLSSSRLAHNTALDLAYFEELPHAEEIAQQAVSVLNKLEVLFLEKEVYQDIFGREHLIDTKMHIVARTLWREWRPAVCNPTVLAHQLVKQLKGNFSYLLLTHARNQYNDREISFCFTDERQDDEKTDFLLRQVIHKTQTEGGRISWSAEKTYLYAEREQELHTLIKGTILADLMQGYSLKEIAGRQNINEAHIKKITIALLEELVQSAPTYYEWAHALAQSFKQRMNEPIKQEVDSTIPLSNERMSMFKNIDLLSLMSLINELPPLEKKIILYYFNYLDPHTTSNEKWIAQENLSSKLYKTSIRRAFDLFAERLGSHQPIVPFTSLKNMVEASRNYHITLDSNNRYINSETNIIYRLLQLTEQGIFPEGTLTERERYMIAELQNSVREGIFPSRAELAQRAQIPDTEFPGVIQRLVEYNFNYPRYATNKSPIAFNSARYKLICWFKDVSSSHKQLLLLTPYQRSFLLAAVTIEEGYYRTPERVIELIQQRYPNNGSIAEFFSLLNNILSILESGNDVSFLYKQLSLLQYKPGSYCELAQQELLRRIDYEESIGHGVQREIAQQFGFSAEVVGVVLRSARKIDLSKSNT